MWIMQNQRSQEAKISDSKLSEDGGRKNILSLRYILQEMFKKISCGGLGEWIWGEMRVERVKVAFNVWLDELTGITNTDQISNEGSSNKEMKV